MFNNEVLRDEFVGDNYYGNAVSDWCLVLSDRHPGNGSTNTGDDEDKQGAEVKELRGGAANYLVDPVASMDRPELMQE
jgi:hypothetical protein